MINDGLEPLCISCDRIWLLLLLASDQQRLKNMAALVFSLGPFLEESLSPHLAPSSSKKLQEKAFLSLLLFSRKSLPLSSSLYLLAMASRAFFSSSEKR
ncbi:hypothetical protein VNO77_02422 [Canavalia gladiata]|uniref:Uncharacterized protein n=1 Tax=Canavalia gladiata TaxID=3824 RepID=A0AAN9MY79_CANGL